MIRPIWIAFSVIVLAGCKARILAPSPGDAKREQTQNFMDENRALQLQNQQLLGQVEASHVQGRVISTEVQLATPRASSLSVEKISRVVAPNAISGSTATAFIFVQVVDGRDRPIQLTGDMSATLSTMVSTTTSKSNSDFNATAASSKNTAAVSHTLATMAWTPRQVCGLYRNGPTGSHYTFEIPLQQPAEAASEVNLQMTYRDGWTDQILQVKAVLLWAKE